MAAASVWRHYLQKQLISWCALIREFKNYFVQLGVISVHPFLCVCLLDPSSLLQLLPHSPSRNSDYCLISSSL